jgi:hypothetical protein
MAPQATFRPMDNEPDALAESLWPDAYGGAETYGDGRLVISFTHDATAHGAELRRRTGVEFLVALVPRTSRELRQLQERIWEDQAAFEAEGIHLEGSAPDHRVGQVQLRVSTPRPGPAMAWIAERYGSAVTVDIVGSGEHVVAMAAIERCTVGPDDYTLGLLWQAGGGVRLLRIELDEHPDAVTIGAVVSSRRAVTADYRLAAAQAHLREPLGDRPLIDARSGRPIGPR